MVIQTMGTTWDSIRMGETPIGLGADVFRAKTFEYPSGGFAYKGRKPCAIIFTDAAGGGTGAYDAKAGKVKLYRGDSEVSGTLSDISVTVFTL
jgi:hypothetical protein